MFVVFILMILFGTKYMINLVLLSFNNFIFKFCLFAVYVMEILTTDVISFNIPIKKIKGMF